VNLPDKSSPAGRAFLLRKKHNSLQPDGTELGLADKLPLRRGRSSVIKSRERFFIDTATNMIESRYCCYHNIDN
jgi:hypothetical protein